MSKFYIQSNIINNICSFHYCSIQQDSDHWSDSYSVNSSPGYSTKSMETPLLLHSKMIQPRSNKKRFILDRYVVCDQLNGRAKYSPANSQQISSSSTSELTKSQSTPASLQAVVEFNESSPNSLQHRVRIFKTSTITTYKINNYPILFSG